MHRVLIVEDDAAARKGLSELLAGAGLAVTAAGSGAEALNRLNEEPFDVMLLDIWMPQMTGLELLGKVRDKADLPKVIIMTADDTPETLLMTLRKEAHQFVRKPVQPKALLELVRRTVKEPAETSIIVLSARPAWVEVLVPCVREIADRIQSYIMHLDVDLPEDTRESMGLVFRELLLDAMEWEGRLDPRRKVRIAYLRTRRMMLYRLADAGYGFRSTDRPFSAAAAPPEERRTRGNGHNPPQVKLQPGVVMARAEADDVIFNEAQNEIVVVKYLD